MLPPGKVCFTVEPSLCGAAMLQVAAPARGISTAIQGLSTKTVGVPVATGLVSINLMGSPFSSLLLSMKRETKTTLLAGEVRVKPMPE